MTVDGEVVGSIGRGLVVLLGVSRDDTPEEARHVAGKVANLRIFYDEEGKFNRSALDIGAELLLVSQSTLYGDTRKGRRPSFIEAARPEQAEELVNLTVELFRETGLKVETGQFQAYMAVSIQNDGPVTVMVDSADRDRPRRG